MEIFVFGSNLAGRHGAGSAREAVQKHGALYGVGIGPQGRSYAIPTKDAHLKALPLDEIEIYVLDFLAYAAQHPMNTFNVVAIGCGLAGYMPKEIAPLFASAPSNVVLPSEFLPYIDTLGAGLKQLVIEGKL